MNFRIILGLTGRIGSGKSFISKTLVDNYGFVRFSFGQLIAELLKEEGLEVNRISQQDKGQELIESLGHVGLVDLLIEKYELDSISNNIVIDGLRHVEVQDNLKTRFQSDDYKLLFIDAPIEIRFQRVQNRGRTENINTFEEFRKIQNRHVEQEIEKLKNLADFVLDNSNSKEESKTYLLNFLKRFPSLKI